MFKPYDTKLIMVVAQEQWTDRNLNQFCKLIPGVYVDGTLADSKDFPNDEEIWWMLTARTAQFAQPGHLVVGNIEDAIAFEPDIGSSSQYQARRDSVKNLEIRDGLEVLDIPGDSLGSIEDLVAGGFQLELPYRPTPYVMLRWRSEVFGPFQATPETHGFGGDRQRFSFSPASHEDMAVFRISGGDFDAATEGFRFLLSNTVSLIPVRRADSYRTATVTQKLVLAQGYEKVLAMNPEKIVLEPIERTLLRQAKDCLNRTKYKQLRALLDDLDIRGREMREPEELIRAIGKIKKLTKKQDSALDDLADGLLKSGVLGDDRLKSAEQKHAEQYIQENIAALQAKVEESVAAKRAELREIESKLEDIQSRLQKEEAARRTELNRTLELERNEALNAIADERADFEKQKAELGRQQEVLQRNLEQVTKDLREAGDEVMNRFLTIAPLLRSIGFTSPEPRQEEIPTRDNDLTKSAPVIFEIPAFISGPLVSKDEEITEEECFERFRDLVENSGFMYRVLDLKRFHLSVKCGEITVLAGPSGTGKSSLPLLYSRALLGEEMNSGRPGCLMVNINPSWMDIRDLLGHMNTLEGRFYPAESGLYQHLILADEEYKSRGRLSGLYLTCLDEMNLSQVEHYFSDFMMVLERNESDRIIKCFSVEAANSSCSFRKWGRITLSPAMKFVGTVNFDETTRLLSDRFLDRANLINLSSESLPAVNADRSSTLAKSAGRVVTLADFEKWQGDKALPTGLGTLLDGLRPILNRLGCPISPRVYRALCRFVGSSMPLMPPEKAFDVQIAQRIVPKIRSLVTSRQHEALDGLLRLLNESSIGSFDETILLLEEIRESTLSRDWMVEE